VLSPRNSKGGALSLGRESIPMLGEIILEKMKRMMMREGIIDSTHNLKMMNSPGSLKKQNR
jgi:hypothetical protein